MMVVMTALRAEAGAALVHLRGVRSMSVPGRAKAWTGWRRGKRVAVACTGPGMKRAGSRAPTIFEALAPEAVVGWGAGGSMVPRLQVGDLVASRSFVDGTTGELLRPNRDVTVPPMSTPPLPGRLRSACSLTWPWPVLRRSTRVRLAERCGCGVVQMEDAALARVCRDRGGPLLGLRTVVDDLNSPRLPGAAHLRFLRRALRAGARCAVRTAAGA